MASKKLNMVFRTAKGSRSTISIENVKDDVTEVEVKSAMDDILSRNVFATEKNGELASIVEAKIVSTDIVKLNVQ
ncbi:protein of unknown function DUF2922 [Gottschalkia purinilytica]|uniref:DUF2922 domain-containing protein n=1 Tax=Gottschalkia purinilytica TaxID=1503 RepID=A0A0L0WDX4_GOTPU|nr:DUF2922 domain-containing protein [Gottschalkia purinilytica]KNF09674.1 protein of unknown function DUF2922 [Gottschalkia purinilytica]